MQSPNAFVWACITVYLTDTDIAYVHQRDAYSIDTHVYVVTREEWNGFFRPSSID